MPHHLRWYLRAYVALTALLLLPPAVLGLAAMPPLASATVLVLGAALGVGAAHTWHVLHDRPARLRPLALAGIAGAAVWPACHGAAALLGPVVWQVAGLLVLGAVPLAVHRIRRGPGEGATRGSLRDLCLAWERTGVALRTTKDPRTKAELASLRQAYLDEMERRDPSGVARWLDAGPHRGDDVRAFLAVE